MTTGAAILVLTAFLASAVEAVEALTVVLAVGISRGWRSSLIGAGAATLAFRRDGQARDGVVDGVSLALNYRAQFEQIIRNSSYDTLLQKIKSKVEQESS
jgi:MlaC protein